MAKKTTRKKKATKKKVETLTHEQDKRRNIPTAEYQSIMGKEDARPIELRYPRNPDLDPQLVWRGKDAQDAEDLVVQAPPLFIQEKVHPKVLVDDLMRRTQKQEEAEDPQPMLFSDLYSDFNGLAGEDAKTEFYLHEQNWTNRMILGDSLQVMGSLAEREGLRGKVQCIYFDPPYGIKFNSNFQWSTTSRDVKDGKQEHITREPEMVKAFRDTWRDGIHSYLTYLRDRLTVARDLLTDSGSIFVQIGDENVHRVRALMDEVFGDENFCGQIFFKKTSSAGSPGELTTVAAVGDYLLWFAKSNIQKKYHPALAQKIFGGAGADAYRLLRMPDGTTAPMPKEGASEQQQKQACRVDNLTSQSGVDKTRYPVVLAGETFRPNKGVWKTSEEGMGRLLKASRVSKGKTSLGYIRNLSDFAAVRLSNMWADTTISGSSGKVYVVQTSEKVVQRCLLMASDPGDLVLDPTCGSGTTAFVAEQHGRRWITIDTSRVSLALARARLMGARYPFYLLADSPEGQQKEADLTHTQPSSSATHGNIRHGFVYRRVPHITLKGIANNAEIDVIWGKWQQALEPLRGGLNDEIAQDWKEWEIPRELPEEFAQNMRAVELHARWWKARIARQREIDESIAAKADFEYLYDRPCEDKKKVRVAGPFTVESISPHRSLTVDENDEVITEPSGVADKKLGYGPVQGFAAIILENLKTAGVQQADKSGKIVFTALTPWPGNHICGEGRYLEGESGAQVEKRTGIFIGPEFGTVGRQDLLDAAREAAEAGFDSVIACAFNYEAHASELQKLGRIPILKARMNADLHMAGDLKNTGKGNLFVIFGEPDIDIQDADDGQIQVQIRGVDVFDPSTGEVRSDNAKDIACWFIDTDYNGESFFVRHAYFLGQNDPYKSLKTTLKAEINQDAWDTLNSDVSRPFPKPDSGRIAVKVINHLGDEVMKIFRVEGDEIK